MDKKVINQRISDRSDCFYWQTDRKISAEEMKNIWKDRHSAISNDELFCKINNLLSGLRLEKIYPFDINAQTSQGNINSIRVGKMTNGNEVVIRCHPRGVKNGYFHVESLVAELAAKNGLPSYNTYLIHDLENEDDISFQVIEKINGNTISFFINDNPLKEDKMVFEMGKTLASLHKIKVNGFGPFDNDKAKTGNLEGLHKTLKQAVVAGLSENLERIVKYKLITADTAQNIKDLYATTNLLNDEQAVLVHNDFADWNLLTDGETITGILDWDECVGGTPIEDIACWSLFFSPERMKKFLDGYFSITPKFIDFEKKLNLFQLRYVISKMALRVKRSSYDNSEFLKNLIENGRLYLDKLLKIYNL